MKTWLITPALLLAASLSMADDMGKEEGSAPAEAVRPAAQAKPVHVRQQRSHARRLPRGDLRHCLELKDSKAIIRCSETGRKR